MDITPIYISITEEIDWIVAIDLTNIDLKLPPFPINIFLHSFSELSNTPIGKVLLRE